MTETVNVINLKDLKFRSPRPGFKSVTLYDENTPTKYFLSGMYAIESGGKLDAHYHDCEELQHVIQGYGVLLDSEGKEYQLSPGSTFYCHSGQKGSHEIKNASDLPFMCLYVYYAPEGKRVSTTRLNP
ncbi:MAG: Cupin 2 protein [Thermoproteota archaeon]|nr:Cupin 2 protein [Thermoproteota archaeon]